MVIREDLSKKVALEQRQKLNGEASHVSSAGRAFQVERGARSKCRGLEAGTCLMHLKNRQEAQVAGAA